MKKICSKSLWLSALLLLSCFTFSSQAKAASADHLYFTQANLLDAGSASALNGSDAGTNSVTFSGYPTAGHAHFDQAIDAIASFPTTNQGFTYSFWAQGTSTVTDQWLQNTGSNASPYQPNLLKNDGICGGAGFYIYQLGSTHICSNMNVADDGTWHMITYQDDYQGLGQMALFIDGALDATNTSPSHSGSGGTANLFFGDSQGSTAHPYYGNMHDACYFSGTETPTQIANMYLNGNCDDSSGGGGFPAPTVYFTFPVNASTNPPFTNWTLHTTNIVNTLTNNPYILGVAWAASGTALNPDLPQDGTIVQNSNVYQFIPSTLDPTPGVISDYHAQAYVAVSGIGIIASSSEIRFSVDATLPLFVNTTVHQVPPEPTSSAFCIAPAIPGDIGGGISFGLCSVAGTFFGEQTPSYGFMQNQWAAFQAVPPFNVIFGVASSVQSAVSSNASNTQQDLSLGLDIGFTTSNVSVLSSDTMTQLFRTAGNGHNIPPCDQTCAQAKTDTVMGWISNVVYAGTGITTMAMIL